MPVGAGFIPARIGENKKMTEHKKLQPEIRFAGFTDDWEQRKAEDVFISISEKNHETFPVLSATQNKGMISRNDVGIDIKYDVNSLKTYKLVRKDQFVIHLRSFQGGFAHSAIDGITSPAYTILDFKDKRIHSPLFWREIFKSDFFIKRLESVIYGIRDGRSINYDEFLKLNFNYPSFEEQTQIGNFFKQLDDTIALHQRELEKFKILKTSYLEHIFLGKVSLFTAKNTITWEQRKLGEVVERITRKNLNLESRLPLTISAQDGLISQTEFFDKQVASKNISGYYLIENGEFAYNKSYSNGYPWGAIKRLDKYKNGVLSTLYIVFNPIDVDSQFLVSYFDTTFWHSEIAEIAVEGARNHGLLNIPVMDFFRIKIKIPKSKEEQTQIGNFFKQLDDTIALHQKELAKYQQIKAACLEKMFVE